jgi:hypothetical protein
VRTLYVLIALAVGIVSGLGLTWLASARGSNFGAVQIGAWKAWPKSGTVEADPYARATFARAGELPLGIGDGIAFVATADDGGAPLDGRCDIHIEGRLPLARFWTLTVYDPRGRLIDNVAERYGYNSAEVVWRQDSTMEIVMAPRARGGNWIPTGARDRLVAILRLYDAPVGFGSRSGDNADLPAIRQEFCP